MMEVVSKLNGKPPAPPCEHVAVRLVLDPDPMRANHLVCLACERIVQSSRPKRWLR